MRIKRWIWFYGREDKRCYGYLYNPHLKDAAYNLDTFNVIHDGQLTLKDVRVKFED